MRAARFGVRERRSEAGAIQKMNDFLFLVQGGAHRLVLVFFALHLLAQLFAKLLAFRRSAVLSQIAQFFSSFAFLLR